MELVRHYEDFDLRVLVSYSICLTQVVDGFDSLVSHVLGPRSLGYAL
jgi:hypothetical protein